MFYLAAVYARPDQLLYYRKDGAVKDMTFDIYELYRLQNG